MCKRIPLPEESIADIDTVTQYDKGAKYYMMPEYKYFVRKILRKGIRRGRELDIGTGSGLLAIELAKVKNSNFDIVGLDVYENMIKKCVEASKIHHESRVYQSVIIFVYFGVNDKLPP